MSRDAAVTLFFGDGRHRFRLAIGELRELQEKTGFGPLRLEERFRLKDWEVDDVRETLRIALVGGGSTPEAASALTTRYCDEVPAWLENSKKAHEIILSALVGSEIKDGSDADMPGKSGASPALKPKTDDGNSDNSTDCAESPASAQTLSTV